jgi:4-hydroxy-tetrahydrodipicolinate synthase
MQDLISGVIPVAPTPFTEDEALDLDGQGRVIEYLIDGGCDAICILANYSEQFSLSDEERNLVMITAVEQAAGRIPIVVTASHFSAKIARSRVKAAIDSGAAMVMLMPPFVGATMRVDEEDVLRYFETVCADLDIDFMVQDAPMSSTPMSVGLLARIAKSVPRLRYAKIEVSRAAQKIRDLKSVVGVGLPGIFDGEESVTLIHDLQAGALGTMCSVVVPDKLGQVVRLFLAGEVSEASGRWEALLPLIHFENRQCGLSAAKVLLEAGGVIASATTRAPIPPMRPETRRELINLASRRDAFILRWAQ